MAIGWMMMKPEGENTAFILSARYFIINQVHKKAVPFWRERKLIVDVTAALRLITL
jgi:hypothetical protein